MKFTCPTELLKKTLSNGHRIILNKTEMPILKGFLFKLHGNQLKIIVSDLSVTFTSTILVEGNRDGACVIDSDTIYNIISSLSADFVTIDVDTACVISTSEKSRFRCHQVLPPDDFPVTNENTSNRITVFPKEVFFDFATLSLSVLSNASIRTLATSIYFDFPEEKIVATNMKTMSVVSYKIEEQGIDEPVLISGKVIKFILDCKPNSKISVSLTHNGGIVFFEFDNYTVETRIIDEKYLPYDSIEKRTETDKYMETAKDKLLDVFRRAVLFAPADAAYLAKMTLTSEELRLSSESQDKESNETISCKFNGDTKFHIGVNANDILKVLQSLNTENICMYFADKEKPFYLAPKENKNIKVYLTPVRLAEN